MCMTKKELENKINELRSLKALQQETADEVKAIEVEIIDYMKENFPNLENLAIKIFSFGSLWHYQKIDKHSKNIDIW